MVPGTCLHVVPHTNSLWAPNMNLAGLRGFNNYFILWKWRYFAPVVYGGHILLYTFSPYTYFYRVSHRSLYSGSFVKQYMLSTHDQSAESQWINVSSTFTLGRSAAYFPQNKMFCIFAINPSYQLMQISLWILVWILLFPIQANVKAVKSTILVILSPNYHWVVPLLCSILEKKWNPDPYTNSYWLCPTEPIDRFLFIIHNKSPTQFLVADLLQKGYRLYLVDFHHGSTLCKCPLHM